MTTHSHAARQRHSYELPPRDPRQYADHVHHLQQAASRIRRAMGMAPVRVEASEPGRCPIFKERN